MGYSPHLSQVQEATERGRVPRLERCRRSPKITSRGTSYAAVVTDNPAADLGRQNMLFRELVTVFLITRPLYELASLLDLIAALPGPRPPVLLSVAPLRSFADADYLAHEVPEVTVPAATLRAMELAGPAARATGLRLAADLLRRARPLVDGVVITMAGDSLAALAPLLAAVS